MVMTWAAAGLRDCGAAMSKGIDSESPDDWEYARLRVYRQSLFQLPDASSRRFEADRNSGLDAHCGLHGD